MATNHCKITPDAPNGKPSKLFQDIQRHTKDRQITKLLWGFTQTDIFKSSELAALEKDENGEVTYEALSKAWGFEKVFSQSKQEMNRAMDMGMCDQKGKASVFENAQVAISKAEEFNKTSKNKKAVVRETKDGRYRTDIEDNTVYIAAEADKNIARRQLNTALLNILQKLGFDVSFADDPSFYGVFDPLLAEKNATNLRTVIQIAKGEKGLNALPEEVSHLILAGLKNHPLKQRLNNVMTDDLVKNILGEEYDTYVKKYSNRKTPLDELLREEAEGKLLYRMLTGQNLQSLPKVQTQAATGLLSRIWNWVKQLFNKTSVQDIDNAFVNAQNAILPITDMIRSGEISTVIDKEQVMKHEKLYQLADKSEKMEQTTEEGLILLIRKLNILQATGSNTSGFAENIRLLKKDIDNGQYTSACYRLMRIIGRDMANLANDIKKVSAMYDNSTDLNVIAEEARVVERISTTIAGYKPYIQTLQSLRELIKSGEIEMDESYATTIVTMAGEYMSQIAHLENSSRQLRFSVLKQVISLYYGNHGEKPEGFTETEKLKWESVDMILSFAKRDISFWDTALFSAGDSKNPLINVIHNIVVSQQSARNNKINKLIMRMQEAQARLHAAGHDNKFVYRMDKDGKPTGYYVSDRDFERYDKEREEFIKELDKKELTSYEYARAVDEWESDRLEEVTVGEPDKDGIYRTEWMPRRFRNDGKTPMYLVQDFQKGWDQAQKDYYDAIIAMKAEMDTLLPPIFQRLYFTPQVRKSVTQMFDKDGRGAWHTYWNKQKQDWSVVSDNDAYGQTIELRNENGQLIDEKGNVIDDPNEVHVLCDFNGNPLRRVPVYFTHRIKDMRDLATDATHAMSNYIAMAVNYSEMDKLASAMRLLQDHVNSDHFSVGQNIGARAIMDKAGQHDTEVKRQYAKANGQSRIAKAIETYINRQFFNDTKATLGESTWKIPFVNKPLNYDALFNIFMKITSVGRMGFNILSGITNATQGETQMLAEATRNQFFNIPDLGFAKKEYAALLVPYMAQFNSINRHDKMYLLINQFNSSEDFFRDMKDKDFNKSAFKRVIGRGNVYLLNQMGEHYLHTAGMLAILHHEKVKRVGSDEVVTLYDVIKPVHDENGWHLELDSDIEFIDKMRAFLQRYNIKHTGVWDTGIIRKKDQDILFENLSVYINRINAGMHGGYSEAERGNNNRMAAWRAVLQFRQWMFGMYNKMYAGQHIDTITGQVTEGSYRTAWRWILGTLTDLKSMSIKEAIEHNKLTVAERRNLRVAKAQTCTWLLLCALGALTEGMKDPDEDRTRKLLAYQIRRLKLETGAFIPWPTGIGTNLLTLIQSPAAGTSTIKTIVDLFDLTSAFEEIGGGRFRGWNRAAKAAFMMTPVYNVQKVIDMKDYNYMFNLFN